MKDELNYLVSDAISTSDFHKHFRVSMNKFYRVIDISAYLIQLLSWLFCLTTLTTAPRSLNFSILIIPDCF